MGQVTARARMLIFGSRGFVGGWLAPAAEREFEVIAAEHAGRVDITDASLCRAAFESARPHIVVLLAAISDIDRCEGAPQLAEAVNVRGPENIARECVRSGARLLFTSSGAVFDGTKSGYQEEDPPTPVSVYGRTKARAERVVREIKPDAVIVRLSLVLGLAASSRTNALVNRLAASWQAGKPVAAPADEYRNAIDAGTLVSFLLELACDPATSGIYHIGSANALSRFEIARALAAELGYSRELVTPQTTATAGRAPRGKYEFLNPEKIAAICRTRVPSCEEAIERCAHATAQSHS